MTISLTLCCACPTSRPAAWARSGGPVVKPNAQVAHIGIAVANLDEALAFYRDILGLDPSPPETADGATIVSLHLGDLEVELMQPAVEDSPISKFLEKRGPGIHHICYRVADLPAALEECRRRGYRLIDEEPRPGAGGRMVAFVHPKATGGILLELTE
ncbi:MAG: methylmalonyl-CoA epimerase [Gemmatimonadota bacterium]|nr:MAG: methylmalonyl-CoA epimerase [Gemmatimonadota bacterium]